MLEPGATIAVVGASARAAAFSLLRAGCNVVAADLFADADLARKCRATRIAPYPDGYTDWLAQQRCDGWLYTGALENYPALVDRLTVSQNLIGHCGRALRGVRDPLALQESLARAGLHFPETRTARSDSPSRNWIGKTYRGSCGSGVGVANGAAFMQRRVEGIPISAVFHGPRLVGVTRQLVGEPWAGASEFQYCGSIAPFSLPESCEAELHRLGELLNNEFSMTDLFGVDLILDGDKLWTIEVNPRYTAAVEVVERAYGLSVFYATKPQSAPSCVGKVVLFAKAPLLVSAAVSDSLLRQAGETTWPELADIPQAGTEIATGQPVLTLSAATGSIEAIERQLRRRVREIEHQLYERTLPCV